MIKSRRRSIIAVDVGAGTPNATENSTTTDDEVEEGNVNNPTVNNANMIIR